MNRIFFINTFLVSFLLVLASCTSLNYFSKQEISQVNKEAEIWLFSGGEKMKMLHPQLQDSSLVGFVVGKGQQEFAVTEIDSVGVTKLNQRKTYFYGIIGVSVALILIAN